MSIRVDVLNNLLETQTDDGLVNFNDIAKTVVANTPSGLPTLLRRGGLEDVKINLVNLNNGDEKKVVRKQGTTYFVDARLAIAFIKQRCPELTQDVTRWEVVYGRADIPEQLGQDAPALLQHLMSIFANSKFRCTFQEGKWYFSLHDVVKAATEDPNVGRTIDAAATHDQSLFAEKRTHTFYGSGEVQIVDINTAARIWMVLPGKKASIFRSNLADLFIRVLGGDEQLADEIKQIGEFQDALPTNHPLRAFRQERPPTAGLEALVPFLRDHMELQRRQLDVQIEFQRQQAEEQKTEREFQRQQINVIRQHMDEQQQTLKRLLEREPQPPSSESTPHSTQPPVRAETRASNTDDSFSRFLHHFFSTQRPGSGCISVRMLMQAYNAFATGHHLPLIETRRKLLLCVNRVSVRLIPAKTEGRIVGWKWT